MISEIDREKAALQIVDVLHKNKIPIADIQSVFDGATKLINAQAFPPDPRVFQEWEDLIGRQFVGNKSNSAPGERFFLSGHGEKDNI